MIKFDKVTKKFGETKVLDEVSFEIEPGELVFFTGPSGAGKTTLVRLILKEIEPTSGKITVSDLDLADLSKKRLFTLRRKIGVAFQDFKLLWDQTVRENVALTIEVLKDVQENADEEIENVLELVGLGGKGDLFPSQLAGGELQRVCVARALVADPEILIADEPTGNLDIATAWQVINLLKNIHKKGKTVLVSTHNFEIVDSLKARVIELDKGKLIRDEKKGKYQVK